MKTAARQARKGFVAYYNVSKGQAVAKAAELGMYYWGIAEEPEMSMKNTRPTPTTWAVSSMATAITMACMP